MLLFATEFTSQDEYCKKPNMMSYCGQLRDYSKLASFSVGLNGKRQTSRALTRKINKTVQALQWLIECNDPDNKVFELRDSPKSEGEIEVASLDMSVHYWLVFCQQLNALKKSLDNGAKVSKTLKESLYGFLQTIELEREVEELSGSDTD